MLQYTSQHIFFLSVLLGFCEDQRNAMQELPLSSPILEPVTHYSAVTCASHACQMLTRLICSQLPLKQVLSLASATVVQLERGGVDKASCRYAAAAGATDRYVRRTVT